MVFVSRERVFTEVNIHHEKRKLERLSDKLEGVERQEYVLARHKDYYEQKIVAEKRVIARCQQKISSIEESIHSECYTPMLELAKERQTFEIETHTIQQNVEEAISGYRKRLTALDGDNPILQGTFPDTLSDLESEVQRIVRGLKHDEHLFNKRLEYLKDIKHQVLQNREKEKRLLDSFADMDPKYDQDAIDATNDMIEELKHLRLNLLQELSAVENRFDTFKIEYHQRREMSQQLIEELKKHKKELQQLQEKKRSADSVLTTTETTSGAPDSLDTIVTDISKLWSSLQTQQETARQNYEDGQKENTLTGVQRRALLVALNQINNVVTPTISALYSDTIASLREHLNVPNSPERNEAIRSIVKKFISERDWKSPLKSERQALSQLNAKVEKVFAE